MNTFFYILGMLALFALIYRLRTLPFRERKTTEPERTASATLISREVTTGANRTGRSSGMGYNYRAVFRLESGEEVTLYAHDHEWGALVDGSKGTLTWKGPYFVGFERTDIR